MYQLAVSTCSLCPWSIDLLWLKVGSTGCCCISEANGAASTKLVQAEAPRYITSRRHVDALSLPSPTSSFSTSIHQPPKMGIISPTELPHLKRTKLWHLHLRRQSDPNPYYPRSDPPHRRRTSVASVSTTET